MGFVPVTARVPLSGIFLGHDNHMPCTWICQGTPSLNGEEQPCGGRGPTPWGSNTLGVQQQQVKFLVCHNQVRNAGWWWVDDIGARVSRERQAKNHKTCLNPGNIDLWLMRFDWVWNSRFIQLGLGFAVVGCYPAIYSIMLGMRIETHAAAFPIP